MNLTHFFLVLPLGFVLLACEAHTPPNIAEPQREALEKAKGVEQTLQKQADDSEKKMNEAEVK